VKNADDGRAIGSRNGLTILIVAASRARKRIVTQASNRRKGFFVADGGEDGIGGVAESVGEGVAAHAMPGFEMAKHDMTAERWRKSRRSLL
jgi:hypothetical protein